MSYMRKGLIPSLTATMWISSPDCDVDTRQSTNSDLLPARSLQSIYQMAECALGERNRPFTKSEVQYVAVRYFLFRTYFDVRSSERFHTVCPFFRPSTLARSFRPSDRTYPISYLSLIMDRFLASDLIRACHSFYCATSHLLVCSSA